MSESVESLRWQLEERSTADLVSILRNRDDEEWRPEVFEVVASLLRARGVSPEEAAALGPEGFDVVESEPTVTVAGFFSPAEAHISRMALEEAGIAAWVIDEAGGTMYGVGIGARLQVRPRDVGAAREILSAGPVSSEALPSDLAEPPCPACGSRHVAPEAWIVEGDATEGGRRLGGRKWHYVCEDCQEAWPA
jgi:Putative prokaryotic signal transducing protein